MSDVTFTIHITGEGRGGEEAVKRVVAAMKQLEQAEKGAAAGAAKVGTSLQRTTTQASAVQSGVVAFKKLLSAVIVVDIGRRLGQMAKGQLDLADATGKLSQSLGIGTEALSVFQHAADLADVSRETLTLGLRNLAKAQQDLKKPGSDAAAALKAIGLSAAEVERLPLDQFFLKVADAQSKYAASAGKLNALGTIFGSRVVAPLIPLLNDLAGEGFAKAREEAERFGLVISQEAADKAQEFNDAMTRLKGSLRGVAGEFATGFAPAAIEAFDSIRFGFHGSESATESFGRTMGDVLKNVLLGWRLLRLDIDLVGKTLFAVLEGAARGPAAFGAALAIAKAQDDAARAAVREELFPSPATLKKRRGEILNEISALEDELRAKGKKVHPGSWLGLDNAGLKRFKRELEDTLHGRGGVVDLPDTGGAKLAQDAAAARLAAVVEGIQAELEARKQGFATELQQTEETHRRGLISAKAFYAERRRLIDAQADAEVAALKRQAEVVATRPVTTAAEGTTRTADVVALNAKIALVEGQQTKDRLANDNLERASAEALAMARLEFEQRILIAKGETARAALDALDREAAAFKAKLIDQGVPGEEAAGRVEELVDVETARISFEALAAAADRVFSEISRKREAIEAQVAAGAISAVDGERQILELERARLPGLALIRDRLLEIAAAITDPAIREALQTTTAGIDRLAESTNRAGAEHIALQESIVAAIGQTISQTLDLVGSLFDQSNTQVQVVEDAWGNVISRTITQTGQAIETLGDFFEAFARIAVNALQTVIEKLIFIQLLKAITGLFGLPFLLFEEGGPVEKKAGGGLIRGPSGRDRVPAMLSAGEYVIKAASVRRIGIDFLEMLNRGGLGRPLVFADHGGRRRYAEGGLVEPGAAQAAGRGSVDISGRMQVGLADGLVLKELRTPAGVQALIEFMGHNKHALRGTLGIGHG